MDGTALHKKTNPALVMPKGEIGTSLSMIAEKCKLLRTVAAEGYALHKKTNFTLVPLGSMVSGYAPR
jgi:hypothetical protein